MMRGTDDVLVAAAEGPGLTGADCFVAALDRRMRRNGQHGLIGQTHLILETPPNLDRLQAAADHLAKAHPLLHARVWRNPVTFAARWRLIPGERRLPVRLWKEAGARSAPDQAARISTLHEWSENILNAPLPENGGLRNLRLDVIFLEDGRAALVLTWTHLLFDGKGAELLATALLLGGEGTPTKARPAAAEPAIPLRQRLAEAKPVVDHFFRLSRKSYASLGGPVPRTGRLHYLVRTLDVAQSEAAAERARQFTGPLFTLGFYLACATRAHRRVFQARGGDPSDYVISVPVQVRRKGGLPSPFQNRVTILFFAMEREALGSLKDAAAFAHRQFEDMTREGLDRAFSQILTMMKRLPAAIYMGFVAKQFSGEITSFFHSFTGDFQLPTGDAFGAKVVEAYHIPGVSSPPGSGVFFGSFRNRITATVSWRDTAATRDEAKILLDQVVADLLGADEPASLAAKP